MTIPNDTELLTALVADLRALADEYENAGHGVRERRGAPYGDRSFQLATELRAKAAAVQRACERDGGPIQLHVYDEAKQAIGVVLHRPGRVEIQPYTKGSAKGKLLVYVYDGTSTDEENEPIGCFDGADPGNKGWVK